MIGISEIRNIAEICLEISNFLIKPIVKFLKGIEGIFFIPYGILHHFPLYTLLLNDEVIVQNYAVAYYPNASLIQYYDNKTVMTKLTAFGVGGNEFDEEAKDVADIYNTRPILNSIKRQVLANLDHEILHFSCHGFFNIEDPLSSGIALFKGSKSGKSESKYDILTANEIFNLRLPTTRLVTPSACETGKNFLSRGGELVGLTRAFMYAGALSLVLSLWRVDSIATRNLMGIFYAYLRNGNDIAKSLQLSMNELRKTESFAHPYFWASFVLIGS